MNEEATMQLKKNIIAFTSWVIEMNYRSVENVKDFNPTDVSCISHSVAPQQSSHNTLCQRIGSFSEKSNYAFHAFICQTRLCQGRHANIHAYKHTQTQSEWCVLISHSCTLFRGTVALFPSTRIE